VISSLSSSRASARPRSVLVGAEAVVHVLEDHVHQRLVLQWLVALAQPIAGRPLDELGKRHEHGRGEQVGLRFEVAVEHGEGDAGVFGDVLLGRAGVAVCGELLGGSVEQQQSDFGWSSALGRHVRAQRRSWLLGLVCRGHQYRNPLGKVCRHA
jgi:hypothetical protein